MKLTKQDKRRQQYVAERNRILLTGTPQDLLQFMRQHGLPEPSSAQSVELTFHKTITGIPSLPIEHRKRSKAWLTARGYQSLDDGELG